MINYKGASAYHRGLMTLALAMLLGWLFGMLFIYISDWFGFPFFLVILGAYFVVRKIVCPNCGTPILYQGSIWGMAVEAGFIRKKCQKCGWDLRKNL